MYVNINSLIEGENDWTKLRKQDFRFQRIIFIHKSVFPNFSSSLPREVHFLRKLSQSIEVLHGSHVGWQEQ